MAQYGKGFLDKLALMYYTFKTPFHVLMKKCGMKPSHTLFKDITLNLGDYKLFCGNYISTCYMASPTFEPFMEDQMYVNEGTFIDVGANIGKYSIKQASRLMFKGTILAIEPEQDNFLKLRKNIMLNKFKDKIIALPVACGEKNEIGKLYLEEPTQGSGVHSMKVQRPFFTQHVPVYTLDYLVETLKLPKVTLMKIDVEGVELDVLRGAAEILKRDKPKIIFEAWQPIEGFAIAEYLKQFGYHTEMIDEEDGENYVAEIEK